MSDTPYIVHKPLLIVFEDDGGKQVTEMRPSETYGYQAYGLIICDVVRHAARAFGVPEAAVWEWVDKERVKPTGGIDTPKVS